MYIEHQPSRMDPITHTRIPAIKGVHKEHLHEFIDEFHHQEGMNTTLMLNDNLSAYRSKDIQSHWREGETEPKYTPPQSAKFVSPLDNSIFSLTKRRLAREDTSTPEKKKDAVQKVVDGLEATMIKNYFGHCGLPHE
jgi:hypothetical protein